MAIKTGAEYVESLRQLKPKVYALGREVKSVADDPVFHGAINRNRAFYDLPRDPELGETIRAVSPLINEEVSRRGNYIQQTMEDSFIEARLTRPLVHRYICAACNNASSVLWAQTWEIDQDIGTNYHQRFREWFKYMQKNDLRSAWGMMDVKGDRSLRPKDQADPYLYLKIVERKSNGIVVRGAKAHTTMGPCQHEIMVTNSRAMAEGEEDYAVSFAIPIDSPGLTFIARPYVTPTEPKEMERPFSCEFGEVVSLSIFEDVFVPWERVFLCGEWQAAGRSPALWSGIHRRSKSAGCGAGRIDIMVGAAALIAQYNGLERVSHIREKLTDMMVTAETAFGCAIGATADGSLHPSGIWMPNPAVANAGCYYARTRFPEFVGFLYDIAGGLAVTSPTEADCKNPATSGYIERYLKGKADVPTEHRLRAFRLIKELVGSEYTGYLMGSVLCAAGTPGTNRMEVYRRYDLEAARNVAKRLAKIPLK